MSDRGYKHTHILIRTYTYLVVKVVLSDCTILLAALQYLRTSQSYNTTKEQSPSICPSDTSPHCLVINITYLIMHVCTHICVHTWNIFAFLSVERPIHVSIFVDILQTLGKSEKILSVYTYTHTFANTYIYVYINIHKCKYTGKFTYKHVRDIRIIYLGH